MKLIFGIIAAKRKVKAGRGDKVRALNMESNLTQSNSSVILSSSPRSCYISDISKFLSLFLFCFFFFGWGLVGMLFISK